MSAARLHPLLFTILKQGYTRKHFLKDLGAGIIVGIVALPLSIAFAIASGVKPEQGIYTAIIAGFLVSLLSGSRVQISGPTGAFIILLFGIVQKYGYDGLAIATIMAGILLVIMGVARFGSVIKYIPYPVTVGFTSGIALLIFLTQLQGFLGLHMEHVPSGFFEKLAAYAQALDTIDVYALGLGAFSLLIIHYWPRVTYKIPGSLVAIVVTTLVVQVFHLPVETIGSLFGAVPDTLPQLRLPQVSRELVTQMLSPALAIAMLASIESLLSAVVADGMTGTRHKSDMELVAQGVANIVSPLFGGIPATGAIARTATNIKNGGYSPVSGIIHSVTLLVILLFLGNLTAFIPMATLSAILIMVAYNMSELHMFIKLFRSPKSDIAVLCTTFLLTVLVDLVVAIEVGVVLASFLFMHRMQDVLQAGYITSILDSVDEPTNLSPAERELLSKDIEVFEIFGPFFFGAADKFKDAVSTVEKPPLVLILRMRHVFSIDATGLRALESLVEKAAGEGTSVVLSGVNERIMQKMKHSELVNKIGEENILPNITEALHQARDIVAAKKSMSGTSLQAGKQRVRVT